MTQKPRNLYGKKEHSPVSLYGKGHKGVRIESVKDKQEV